MRVAFLTLEQRGSFVVDDALAIAELARLGVQVDEVPWTADADWSRYRAVVVRSTWDYQHRVDAFLSALARIADVTRLANPLEVIRWNVRKTYLRELAERGVRIVPTTYGDSLSVDALRALCASKSVLKPQVSANADHTHVLDATTPHAELAQITAQFASRPWMLQPFVKSVAELGEYSIFFFDGARSHAILKTPRAGDFRVQEEHGGFIRAAEPPAEFERAAADVMRALGREVLQARVDLVQLDDGAPALMELELIEPSLYFRTSSDAPKKFARALEAWLARTARA